MFIRKCPNCEKELNYTCKKNKNKAERKQQICGSCAAKARPPQSKESIEKRKRYGTDNHFYGKHHATKTKLKSGKAIKENRINNPQIIENHSNFMKGRFSGEKNPMYKKTFYERWFEKYGKEIADEKMGKWLEKRSKNSKGEKNAMYGKPSPHGSGNGWSGWYKGWYFRSLLELSYLIKEIERKGLEWESGEQKKFQIIYEDFTGQKRNYYVDFVVEKRILIECKPKKLWTTDKNTRKKEAALIYCESKGLEYKMVDIEIITNDEIVQMYINKTIIFLPRYEIKFKEKYCKNELFN